MQTGEFQTLPSLFTLYPFTLSGSSYCDQTSVLDLHQFFRLTCHVNIVN